MTIVIRSYDGKAPAVHREACIADTAQVIGNVEIGAGSSVWYGTVVRGDICRIVVGENTNIQDNCVVHGSSGTDAVLGDNVTIGHGAVLHGCVVGDNCLVGMGAIVLDGVEMGSNVIVGAGALVTKNTKIPSNTMMLGSPAKAVRSLTEEEADYIRMAADTNGEMARQHFPGKD